jgi:dTDP-4-dehydrorhamnose 3,5-epimerase
VDVRELSIACASLMTPTQHHDDRGIFLEWFRHEPVTALRGAPFPLRQANLSVSRRGVVRGVHYALVPPGQAKYVTVVVGSVVDYVVDIRIGSPTFGRAEGVVLDDIDRRALYLAEGLGHAFVATSENATLCYAVSEVFDPEREFAVDAFDPDLTIDWPSGLDLSRSPRDAAAPSLRDLAARELLPRYEDCIALGSAVS